MAIEESSSSISRPLTIENRKALEAFGWNEYFEQQLREDATLAESYRQGMLPGRVVLELRGVLQVASAAGPLAARVPGRMHHDASTGGELPAVGDWVLVRPPERQGQDSWTERIFHRFSKFSRQAAGARTQEQVVAANVDRFLVMMGIDGDFQPRRLERYASSIKEAGAEVCILLNKIDLDLDQGLAEFTTAVRTAVPNTPVHLLSAQEGQGVEELADYLRPGKTLALVGSSGVGKSTLLNRLLGTEAMKTGEVRSSDDRGRHTTSHRQLLQLPSGALLIDNPGIRELQLWDSEEGIEETFTEISELAEDCRFSDCLHRAEPGCSVQQALADGTISKDRLRSYWKLRAEQSGQSERQTQFLRSRAKQKTKLIHHALREKNKRRYR